MVSHTSLQLSRSIVQRSLLICCQPFKINHTMNVRGIFLLATLSALLITGCKKDKFRYSDEFRDSVRVWQGFKASTNNSYRYTVEFSSWVGISTKTTITVRNGKVTGRSYVLIHLEYVGNQSPPAIVEKERWEETESTLNTHTSGAATITLDAIYEQAASDWLQKREDATTYFEAKNNGMISSCGYVPDGCADDCFRGIHISSIERL